MTTNMASLDRLLRALLGAALLAIALAAGAGTVGGLALLALAAIMLVTAALAFCPLYRFLHIDTRRLRSGLAAGSASRPYELKRFPMLELYQTEWCPASHRVRERLTELGLDYLIHQVPVDRSQRTLLRERTGSDTIPVLVIPDGAIVGEDAIAAHLAALAEPPEARAHRLKAEKARRRYLEEEINVQTTLR